MHGRPLSPMEDFDEAELEEAYKSEGQESERQNLLDLTTELRDVNAIATNLERQHTILLLRKVELSAKLSRLEKLMLKRNEKARNIHHNEGPPPAKKQKKQPSTERKTQIHKETVLYESDKAFSLSEELSSLIGPGKMNRQEVRRRIMEIINEENLYDPDNKDYAICNQRLLNVFGVERFRILGMMSYLDKHFLID